MRRQAVAFFLGDAAFMADAKFRRLARILPDPDDFNSAVGAYFVALAAARRNGLPDLDLPMETQSRWIPQLIEVGLLVEGGFPDKAFRSWAPSRPPRPSERPVPSVPNDAECAESVESAENADARRLPSPPLPSTPLPSTGGPGGSGLPNLNSAVAKVWEDATGLSVIGSGEFAVRYLDDACRRHPASEVGAAIIRARRTFEHIPAAQPLIVAVRAILDPLPDPKAAKSKDAAAAEKAASDRRRGDTLRRTHALGAHATDVHPLCPSCQEGAA